MQIRSSSDVAVPVTAPKDEVIPWIPSFDRLVGS